MSWFKKKFKNNQHQQNDGGGDTQLNSFQPNTPSNICRDVFKSHWQQILEVMKNVISTENINTVQNLLEYMVYLLVEEQNKKELLGPVLEYAITEQVFDQLLSWCNATLDHSNSILLSLLKMYEVLISHAQNELLHQKQIVKPLLKLLSLHGIHSNCDEVDSHKVLVLNLLCVWMNRDPTLLQVFFHSHQTHGDAKFLIFSLLIQYIHREGTVGQQARDALLLCMSLSSQQISIAKYIVENSNFAPVLATGLSALYSTLPRHIDIKADDWHCLHKCDWIQVPELSNFLNSLQFCNSVVEVAHPLISEQLIEFIHNGFLISVFGPSLHKTSVSEVIVTTAYLNLFLQSATSDALIKCFLSFLLTHCHDHALIINTLIQRANSSNRLSLVSLSLIRTLVDLNCEDLMLQLVLRYLVPCHHVLASQRRSISDRDLYNSSAQRFLALTPTNTVTTSTINSKDEDLIKPMTSQDDTTTQVNEELTTSETPPSAAGKSRYTINEDLSVTIDLCSASQGGDSTSSVSSSVGNMTSSSDMTSSSSQVINDPHTMAEFGSDLSSQLKLNTSYMDYLEDAHISILKCREGCELWSAAYDGTDPPPSTEDPTTTTITETASAGNDETISNQQSTHTDNYSDNIAMKALNATQQMINLTKLVFPPPISSTLSSPLPVTSPQENVTSSSPLPVTSPQENMTSPSPIPVTSSQESVTPSQDNVTSPHEDTNVTSPSSPLPQDDRLHTSLQDDVINKSDSDVINKPDSDVINKPDSDVISKPDSDVILKVDESSSVDDFFRSLMEIVPKQTRDKVENTEDHHIKIADMIEDNDDVIGGDGDMESGIGLSSDGDPNINNNKNEDICGDEVESDEDITNNNTSTDEDEDLGTTGGVGGVDLDQISLASSSFYEYTTDEYKPTQLSTSSSAATDIITIEPVKMQAMPFTGPLMVTLFGKLDQMMSNSLYENLLLTGVLSRLACYPQPLLRSFLLNTRMVFHPSVRSLYQVLTNVRNKLLAYSSTIVDFPILVGRAQKYLLARGCIPHHMNELYQQHIERPMPVPKVKTRVLGDILRRKRKQTNRSVVDSILEKQRSSSIETLGASTFYLRQQERNNMEERKSRELKTKNAVYATIVFAEFLKELAAVSQEHAIMTSSS